MDPVFEFTAGSAAVLVSIPHDGRLIPPEIAGRMTERAQRIPDTDWHMGRLYDFTTALGASVLAAQYSRYVVDLNRDPAGGALYPGADNTEIVPSTTFDREPIYSAGQEPDAGAIAGRIERYWRPYHDRLAQAISEMRDRFGHVVVFDAHSIRSVVPRFFEGTLPDFNFGTASGASTDAGLAARTFAVLDRADGFTAADNGRFTGGYITRHYGDPAGGVHLIQLELSQRTYMNETDPFDYRPDRAATVQPVLREMLQAILDWAK